MSPSSTSQHRRAGHRLAVSAAALAVTLLPTACDNAAAATRPPRITGSTSVPTTGAGHAGHGADHGYGSADPGPVVVPAGNTATPHPTPTPTSTPAPETTAPETSSPHTTTPETVPPTTTTPPPPPGLVILGNDCSASTLAPHDGFQLAPRCVATAFGEVAAQEQSPSLLITDAPTAVAVGKAFTISVSTRNLVRDRFLGAAAGGYYRESSFLDRNGLQRGHFHTACRMLESTTTAPNAAPIPAFFVAIQDNGGGATPDTVVVTVPGGLPAAGTAQCAVWAGDGSHRVPMMQRANQTPAFDAVRITVG